MRHFRTPMLLGPALVAVASLLLLSGCSAFPFVTQSPSQLAMGAYTSWEGAAALHFKGRLSIKKGTAQVTVTEWVDTTPGASLGTVEGSGAGTLAGKPFKYVAVTVASARTASVPGTVDVLQSQTLPAWYWIVGVSSNPSDNGCNE